MQGQTGRDVQVQGGLKLVVTVKHVVDVVD